MANSVVIENFPETEDLCERVEIPQGGDLEQEAISHYKLPSKDSIFPLEYAFYLLGSVSDKTVIVAGELETSSVSILSSMGGRIVFAEIENEKIILPADDGRADHVFCGPVLRHVDPLIAARQIRRVLKPGGSAVFNERIDNETVLRFKAVLQSEYQPRPVPPRHLTIGQVHSVSRAVGLPGRRREFWLATPLLDRMGFGLHSIIGRISQRADAALLRRCSFIRRFAYRLVWEARKEC